MYTFLLDEYSFEIKIIMLLKRSFTKMENVTITMLLLTSFVKYSLFIEKVFEII